MAAVDGADVLGDQRLEPYGIRRTRPKAFLLSM